MDGSGIPVFATWISEGRQGTNDDHASGEEIQDSIFVAALGDGQAGVAGTDQTDSAPVQHHCSTDDARGIKKISGCLLKLAACPTMARVIRFVLRFHLRN